MHSTPVITTITWLRLQLATFMNDLESSGLLGSEEPGAQQPAPSVAAGAVPVSSAQAAPPAAAGASASTDKQPAAGSSSTLSGGVSAGASSTVVEQDGGSDEQAEQRVLGPLSGRPDWTEVMDMGSRRVYFWNVDTDAVEWEAPEGGTPCEVPEEQSAADDAAGRAGGTAGAAGPQQEVGSAAATDSLALVARPAQQSEAGADAGTATEPREVLALAQLPSADLSQRTASLVERLRAAAGGLFAAAPKLVWLAIEAELRAKVPSVNCQRGIKRADCQNMRLR
jgi:hypothetical protein